MLDTLSPPKRKIIDLIKLAGLVTMDELTAQAGLSETTIRQHLRDLVKSHLVVREAVRQERGRPHYHYRLTETGQALYPSSDGALFKELLRELISGGREDNVVAFFEAVWARRATEFEHRLEQTDGGFESRLRVLYDLLDEEGFMPDIERDCEAVRICERHCPLRQAVSATSFPCRVEEEFMRRVLGRSVRRVDYLPTGGRACVYEVAADSGQP